MEKVGFLNIEQNEKDFMNVHLTQEQCEYVQAFLGKSILDLELKKQKNDSELDFLEEMKQILRVFDAADSAIIRSRLH